MNKETIETKVKDAMRMWFYLLGDVCVEEEQWEQYKGLIAETVAESLTAKSTTSTNAAEDEVSEFILRKIRQWASEQPDYSAVSRVVDAFCTWLK